jgi:tellurite resistance protein TerC
VSATVRNVIVWVALGLAVGVWVAVAYGSTAGAEYYAAYFLEQALSIDNVFVFVIVFAELGIPREYQRRVLQLGIAGALILRGLMIAGGITLINRFGWVSYLFGALLGLAAWRLLFGEERERKVVQEACSVCNSWIAHFLPVTPLMDGSKFWRRQGGRLVATPLFVALVVIETADIVFAADSVPAVLAITRNPVVVYSSNVMAVVALRSLYFVLVDALPRVRYLRQGLAVILALAAARMLADEWVHVNPIAWILVIGLVMLVTVVASRHQVSA